VTPRATWPSVYVRVCRNERPGLVRESVDDKCCEALVLYQLRHLSSKRLDDKWRNW